MLRLAIDTGGTFTDCVLADDERGEMWFWKVLSTPDAPDHAVLEGVAGLASLHPFALSEVAEVLIATTVATNAILERKGARCALVTTRGFRDVLFLGRAKRYDTYDLHLDKPRPLLRRRDVVEVDERVAHDGAVLRPLDGDSLEAAAVWLGARDPEAVAVCLLHAYANPEHERAVAARLARALPGVPVSLSCTVSPRYREYERTSTTVANAYVTPVVVRFLDGLEAAFRAAGFRGRLLVMQSSGGLLSPDLARALPVNIVESGPAAGVLLGGVIGREQGLDQVISFDMGGTTAKVGVVEHGEPAVSTSFEVDGINLRQWSGLPLSIAAVELVEIGAGGGSVASTELGVIRVGPESAGARPGPVCYGRGGERATITDANLLLGYLDPARFAGGRLALARGAAENAVHAQIARPLGLGVLEAAWGVHAVANASMERALRSMSIERGRDPRDFSMIAFGGAGPLHACRLARALGVRQVIVPWGAGVGSAVGMLSAQPRVSASVTRIVALQPDADGALEALFAGLEERLRGSLPDGGRLRWERHAYARYRGQGYELRIAIPNGPIGPGFHREISAAFHAAYREMYGYDQPAEPVEVTDWYLTLSAPAERAGSWLRAPDPGAAPPAPVPPRRQPAYFPEAGGLVECLVHDRHRLPAGATIDGPAIIAEDESTTLVPPGDRARVAGSGHLLIEVAEE